MTLLEMADLICDTVHQTDTDAVALAKQYLVRAAEYVWQDGLWRESLITVNAAYAPETNTLHATGVYLLPSIVDRIVACRTTDRELVPDHVETYYRQDLDSFADQGTPVQFYEDYPVAWQFGEATDLLIYAGDAADVAMKAHVRYLDASDVVNDYEFGLSLDGYSPTGVLVVEMLSKPDTTAPVRVSNPFGTTEYFSVATNEHAAARRSRLHLMQAPDAAVTVRVLAKRRMPKFEFDHDIAPLRSIDNLLIGGGLRWMLKRERQIAKSLALDPEFQRDLAQLRNIEQVQQAHRPRLIPDTEFEEYEQTETKGYF